MVIEFVTLTCPTCGGKLEVGKDINQFACGHCGNEHVVVRQGGLISLSPVEQNIAQIQKSTDKTAAELAIKRLSEEIHSLNRRYDSLLNRAQLGNYGSILLTHKIAGTLASFSGKRRRKAIEEAPAETIHKVLSDEENRIAGKNVGSEVLAGIEYLKDLIMVKTDLPHKKALLDKNKRIAND